MKRYKILSATLAIVSMVVSSCDKFGSTNDDPSKTSTPIPSALLTSAESRFGAFAASTRGALYCQYISETQYTDVSLYATPKLNSSASYPTILMDLQNIIKLNTEESTKTAASVYGSNANQIAIATILKSYILWTISDSWGDIPYTSILNGSTEVTFDTQETIYKGLITDLTNAVALFDGGLEPKGDIIFAGDPVSWKKFANSLRAIMALRLSKVYTGSSDYAATEFKKALADDEGVIESNDDNLIINYPGTGTAVDLYINFKNPWYNTYDGRKDYGESEPFVTLMTTLGDGRQEVFGSSTLGVPYGLSRTKADAWQSSHSGWSYCMAESWRTAASSLFVVTAANVLLARAEAAERGWTTEDADDLYLTAIEASFTQWGLEAPSDDYLTQSDVDLSASSGTRLQKIAVQTYISYYPNGTQGWSEWRRTGYPVLTPAVDAVNTSKEIPRRYVYGDDEYGNTPDAVAAAAARLSGGDSQDAHMWWDVVSK